MYINENTVKTGPVIITWDGITNPEQKDGGGVSHNLRVAMPENAPEKAELDAIAQKALAESKWKGVLPPGANMPFGAPDIEKLGNLVAGHTCFTASTYRGAPPVYDLAGNKLDPIQYNSQLYAGCKVALLVHAFDYDNKQKGIAFGLDGFQIIDANAPKLDVGAGMKESEVASAFGGGGGEVMQAAPATNTAPPPPPTGNTPPPPPSAALEPKTYNVGGHPYTEEQLVAAGYTPEQIAAL